MGYTETHEVNFMTLIMSKCSLFNGVIKQEFGRHFQER